jgi:hypothetical protein
MNDGPAGVVSLVCLTCGNERHFDDAVPSSLTCEKCQGTVFRQFATPTEPDDATIDALEAQARSIALDGDAPSTARDDVRDLEAR